MRPVEPEAFVRSLAGATIGDTFNFYRDGVGADVRVRRLAGYLAARREAPLVLAGEAAGYRGARVSGIPFTSERQVSGRGPSEATATIVRRVLEELDAERDVLLWNVVPTHPHRRGDPASNRRPSRSEVEAGRPFLDELRRDRRAIAVGRLAEAILGGPYVRHPSHGGAVTFRSALMEAIRG
jgi:uracil-DNA glycosylase